VTPKEYKKLFESEEFETQYYYDGTDLGAVYTLEKTMFKLWAPTAKKVGLLLYASGDVEKEDRIRTVAMNLGEKGVWSILLEEDLQNIYYTYQIEADGYTCETIDPYAKACGTNGLRGMVVKLPETNPEGWAEDQNFMPEYENPIIYELHVKDFSHDIKGGFQSDYRGKYLAFTEQNTTLKSDGTISTGMAYLKELGINYVHLLPVFDFASVDEAGSNKQFNWGYDPQNYNIPEGSYATDASKGNVRIKEFKKMVEALHNAGIGVIMDVVYNHTYETDSSFQKTVPYYYYRQNEDGTFSNGSACGNETASERIMFRSYMINSILYWAQEYHIDGFRFDLMGLHDVETMNAIRKNLDTLPKKILMYGEPWVAGNSAMAKNALPAVKANLHLLDENISVFCDNTRDAIKGSVFDSRSPGFINGDLTKKTELQHSIRAWCDGGHDFKPKSQKQIITYVSAHDNYTLWDKLMLTTYKNPNFAKHDKKIMRQNFLIASIIFTSQGIPFFQAGEEFGRTKLGEENSYNKSPEINKLDWTRRKEYVSMVNYYKDLILFRKSFSFNKIDETKFKFIEAGNGLVMYEVEVQSLSNDIFLKFNNVSKLKVLVILNANRFSKKINLNSKDWKILGNGFKLNDFRSAPISSTKIRIKKKTALILFKDVFC